MARAIERNFSLWDYHNRLLDELPTRPGPEDDLTATGSLASWQQSFRIQLGARLGDYRPDGPRHLEIGEVVALPGDVGFTRHRVVFRSESHLDTPAWLLVPGRRREPGPAVLALHGHGPDPWIYDHGRDAVCGPVPDDEPAAAALAEQCPPFGADLARAGFVVLAPDLRGFGERWDRWPEGHRMCDHELAQQLALGRLPVTGNLRDLVTAIDVLAEHDLVDAERIGVAGFSLGGTLALLLAALDERVRATVVSGAFSDPREAARVPFDVCGIQVIPGLVAELDHVQLAAAIAPRALFVEAGDDDFISPSRAASKAAARAAELYMRTDAAERFTFHSFPGPHRWDGAGVTDFLMLHLDT
jgi:dienelactone hydrolase